LAINDARNAVIEGNFVSGWGFKARFAHGIRSNGSMSSKSL
jgi:hypothetical protein